MLVPRFSQVFHKFHSAQRSFLGLNETFVRTPKGFLCETCSVVHEASTPALLLAHVLTCLGILADCFFATLRGKLRAHSGPTTAAELRRLSFNLAFLVQHIPWWLSLVLLVAFHVGSTSRTSIIDRPGPPILVFCLGFGGHKFQAWNVGSSVRVDPTLDSTRGCFTEHEPLAQRMVPAFHLTSSIRIALGWPARYPTWRAGGCACGPATRMVWLLASSERDG